MTTRDSIVACRNDCWTQHIDRSNKGLMGPAHASSGAGFSLLFLGVLYVLHHYGYLDFLPFNMGSLCVVIAIVIACAGSVMVPDLDNSEAKIISIMGFTGKPLSAIFRGSSKPVQSIIRSPKDDPTPNPHRGFWHSTVGAMTLGFLVFLGCSVQQTAPLWVLGHVKIGSVTSFVVMVVLTNIMNSSLPNSPEQILLKRAKSFELFSLLFSATIVTVLFAFLPEGIGFGWLGFSVFLGMFIHILGDALTIKGVPIFFPVCTFWSGKMWYMTRIAKFEADSTGLNKFIVGLSTAVGIIGILMFCAPQVVERFFS